MKKIQLLNLKLVNFKGIKEFELNAAGENVRAFGDNATGKSTLFDGFVWLLFNKDSQNKSDFGIKTLDSKGHVIHKLDHEVEGTFYIENNELTLRKVYKEKWTKKKGSPTSSFTGHRTDHFVNAVPVKKKEYEDMIQRIVQEDIFKLLTSPSFFNEQLHWKDQRDLLLEVAGDVDDTEVIASNESLSKLTDVLNGNSIEDHRKIIASKRRDINKELEKIPVRVDEIHRNLPDVNGLNEDKINTEMAKLLDDADKKHEQINGINNGSEVNELKKKISDIELKINTVKNDHQNQGQQELYKLQAKLQEEQSNLTILRNDISNEKHSLEQADNRIKGNEQAMDKLRNDYVTENEKEFTGEHSCPTCTQPLPADQIDEAKANFNRNKSKALESINKKGIELKGEVEQLQINKEKIEKEINKITDVGKKKANDIEKLESKIKDVSGDVKPIEVNEQYIKLNSEKQALEQQIEQLEQSVTESVQKVQVEIATLKEHQGKLQIDLSNIAQSKQSTERIAELEAQEKKLAAEFEQLELELHLTEEFTRTKVNMLTEKINNKFKYARFNLFKENINGGLEEVCETTFDGVPYSSGLNNAAQINVGLDIINTLSAHYGVQAPIFVDNAEGVTELIDIDSQIISLVVSEQDKELRVEGQSVKESEVA